MPHIILQHSPDVARAIKVDALLERLHEALGETEGFELDRIKSRVVEHRLFVVGRDRDHGFAHATVLFSRGREPATRRAVGQRLLGVLEAGLEQADRRIDASIEVRQFEEGMYFRHPDPSA